MNTPHHRIASLILFCFAFMTCSTAAPDLNPQPPVNSAAMPEAVELLNAIYQVSGNHTLTGQHNFPSRIEDYSKRINEELGVFPAVFGQDFGFSPRDTLDDITRRQEIINTCIQQHKDGAIITLMWHAVRPIEEEPVTFKGSIQGELTDQEWQDLITPGTHIHAKWCSQVDVIAWHLKQLQEAKVPVLWRPYHEMNGGWFWWGHKEGPDGYVKLWRMLYDRLVNFHGLNNLIWVWNANERGHNKHEYARYFPGYDVVDILATDVYRENFSETDYLELLELAQGKPIAIGECGPLPTPEILKAQPRWAWFMSWSEFPWKANSAEARQAIYHCDQTLTREER